MDGPLLRVVSLAVAKNYSDNGDLLTSLDVIPPFCRVCRVPIFNFTETGIVVFILWRLIAFCFDILIYVLTLFLVLGPLPLWLVKLLCRMGVYIAISYAYPLPSSALSFSLDFLEFRGRIFGMTVW